MHSSARTSLPDQTGSAERRLLRVLVISEEEMAQRRASQSVETLMRGLNSEFDFDLRLWRLESLNNPEFRQDAAGELPKVEVLLFSFSAGQPLKEEARRWLEQHLHSDMDQPRALAVLCTMPERPRTEGKLPPFAEFLRRAARAQRMAFFAEVRHLSVAPVRPAPAPKPGSLPASPTTES